MGRNPAVGRQGPAYYSATIPAEGAAARLRIKQIRSAIGQPETMRRTLKSLGLKHHQSETEIVNNASTRGMLLKVRHLVKVTPASEA
jgi:large subunit ribosomal protein L30